MLEKESFLKMYNMGLSDKEMSVRLGTTPYYIRKFRNSLGLPSNFTHRVSTEKDILSQEQIEILTVTLLGDSSLQFFSKDAKTPAFSCTHGKEQESYATLKAKKLNGTVKKRNRFDKRTNKIYESYCITTKTNYYYKDLYKNLYKDGKKVITQDFLKNFTDISLAYLYMDDGYTSHGTAFICTDAFDQESLDIFIKFLNEKFSLIFRKTSRNRIRLSFRSRINFCNLIEKFMLDELKYKLPPKEVPLSLKNNYKKTTEEFILELRKIYGDKYDYSKVNYVNNKTPVCLIESGEQVFKTPLQLLCSKKIRRCKALGLI